MDRIHDYTHYLQQCVSITETIQLHLGEPTKICPPPARYVPKNQNLHSCCSF